VKNPSASHPRNRQLIFRFAGFHQARRTNGGESGFFCQLTATWELSFPNPELGRRVAMGSPLVNAIVILTVLLAAHVTRDHECCAFMRLPVNVSDSTFAQFSPFVSQK